MGPKVPCERIMAMTCSVRKHGDKEEVMHKKTRPRRVDNITIFLQGSIRVVASAVLQDRGRACSCQVL